MEELAMLLLNSLDNKFFLAVFPLLMSLAPGDVEATSGVRGRDDPCGCFLLVCQGNLWDGHCVLNECPLRAWVRFSKVSTRSKESSFVC